MPFASFRPALRALVVVIWQNRIHLAAFPGIIGAYSAKEYCPCRYVMGNSADYCRAYAKQYVPTSAFLDDEARKRVTVRGLGSTQTAAWRCATSACAIPSSRSSAFPKRPSVASST